MRRLRIALGTLVVLAVILVALVPVGPRAAQPKAEAAPEVRISASRSATGSDAALLEAGGRKGHAVWRSSGANPVGVTLTTRLSRPTSIGGMRLAGAGPALRITNARVEFSDGSNLLVRTNRTGGRSITFPARQVRWVRLVVTEVAAGQRTVGLSRWTVTRRGGAQHARIRGDATALARQTTSSGAIGASGWTAAGEGRQWLLTSWSRPLELAAVRLFGGGSTASTVRNGYLEFSDGSRIIVGTLEPRGGAPTTIAFTPRMTRSVRFVATEMSSGRAAVRRVATYTVGSVVPAAKVPAATYTSSVPAARSCASTPAGATRQLVLRCPSNGSRVGGTARLVVSGPIGSVLTVAASIPSTGDVESMGRARVGTDGVAHIAVPMRRLAKGPTPVRITGTGVSKPLYVQLENDAGVRVREPHDDYARGMNLVLDERFSEPISTTRTGAGATYTSGKPNPWGVDEFGDAIFAQPSSTERNIGTDGGYLRIRTRGLAATETDPGGFGRRVVGGLISSGHIGGSGFAAQYGYFEIRMLAPVGDGSWPAFWLLSKGSQSGASASAGEVDAVELYGHDPLSVCQSAHSWVKGKDRLGDTRCSRIAANDDLGLTWHTYGAHVTPTGTVFTIDGVESGRSPAVVDNDEPFFYLVDLALGGGWPVDLSGTGPNLTLYVDSIRVWV